jgi:hypothetical protein
MASCTLKFKANTSTKNTIGALMANVTAKIFKLFIGYLLIKVLSLPDQHNYQQCNSAQLRYHPHSDRDLRMGPMLYFKQQTNHDQKNAGQKKYDRLQVRSFH